MLEVHEYNESKGAWSITCPVGHTEDHSSKTFLYPSGIISCMAGKCQGKPLAWFLDHLAPEDAARVAQSATTIKVEAPQPQVTVAEAHADIASAIDDNRAVEAHCTVIQVSTGAGKTHTIAEKLNVYSAPYEDEGDGSGLSSVLAVPTNALLHEVEDRIHIPHRVRTGVLAVLNDDGSPACKKHAIAKSLQSSGGNVHKLLCGHCEFKEGCPARENASRGEGALTLTNHALMSAVANDLFERGRHPLLVWDESPQWVTSAAVTTRDLSWLLKEFDREAMPIISLPSILDAMVDVRLFSSKYRVVVRPMLEAIRWIRATYPQGTVSAKQAVSFWARIPGHGMMLTRALMALGLESEKDPWKDLVASFTGAAMLNTSEMGFDVMRKETQDKVLRAESIVANLGLVTQEDAVLVLGEHFIMLAALTSSGATLRRYGGVVLDATANLAELKALRPDLRAVSLRVRDRGDSQRYMNHVASLDRKSLTHRTERLEQCVKHASAAVRRWATAEGISKPKTVVFTYSNHVGVVKAAWPEAEVAYFGNTRGYDRFFQEGFDAFVTIGDPIANLTSLALQWRVLTGKNPVAEDPAWRDYVGASAESELAQAHGRARSPQKKLGAGGRLHVHYGRRVPSGWNSENMRLDPLSFKED